MLRITVQSTLYNRVMSLVHYKIIYFCGYDEDDFYLNGDDVSIFAGFDLPPKPPLPSSKSVLKSSRTCIDMHRNSNSEKY